MREEHVKIRIVDGCKEALRARLVSEFDGRQQLFCAHTHTSLNTLIQSTVGLNQFKCMLRRGSGGTVRHTGRQHEEPPGRDLIKYGTTNLAAINFMIRLQQASPPRCGKAAGPPYLWRRQVSLRGLFCFQVANHQRSETEESDKSGTAVNQPR